jgi:hypothetical protein
MLEIKQDVNRPFSITHANGLSSDDRTQGGNALLAIKKQALRGECTLALSHCKISRRRLLIGLPDQDPSHRATRP